MLCMLNSSAWWQGGPATIAIINLALPCGDTASLVLSHRLGTRPLGVSPAKLPAWTIYCTLRLGFPLCGTRRTPTTPFGGGSHSLCGERWKPCPVRCECSAHTSQCRNRQFCFTWIFSAVKAEHTPEKHPAQLPAQSGCCKGVNVLGRRFFPAAFMPAGVGHVEQKPELGDLIVCW